MSRQRNSKIHLAAESQNLNLLVALLADGANVGAAGKEGCTPLHCAFDAKLIQQLLDNGADSSARNNRGQTPLHCIENLGINVLISEGIQDINVRSSDGFTPLHCAAEGGDSQMVAILIAHGADVDALTDGGEHAMFMAIRGSHYEVVSELLTVCSPRLRNKQGETALHLAANCGNVECVEILIEAGASIKCRNYRHQTPWMAYQNSNAYKNRSAYHSKLDAAKMKEMKELLCNKSYSYSEDSDTDDVSSFDST